jgi:hypothetical protein
LVRLADLAGAWISVVAVDVDLAGHLGATVVGAGTILGFVARSIVGRVSADAGHASVLGAGDLVIAAALVATFAAHAAAADLAVGAARTKVTGSLA